MSVTFLQSFFADETPEQPNFFSGRVLTAQALQQEQKLNVQRARWLGQALGAGVAKGLFVRKADGAQAVQVGAGMAINPRGDLLVLDKAKTFPLTDNEAPEVDVDDALFANCVSGEPITGDGYYLLAITYASADSGEAAAYSGISPTAQNCHLNTHSNLGVQFKLIELEGFFTPDTAGYNDLSAEEKALMPYRYRSQLAQQALNVADSWADLIQTPFKNSPAYGLVDILRAAAILKEADVPLAVLYWNNGAISFVDVWSVRRPVLDLEGLPSVDEVGLDIPLFLPHRTKRMMAEQEAIFLQFQNQLRDMLLAADYPHPASWCFTHLPAAGYLPFPSSQQIAEISSSTPGATWWRNFFDNPQLPAPKPIDPSNIREIFHRANFVAPISVTRGEPVNQVRLYSIDGYQTPYYIYARSEAKPAIISDNRGTLLVGILGANEEGMVDTDLNLVSISSETQQGEIGVLFDRLDAAALSEDIVVANRAMRETLLANLSELNQARVMAGTAVMAIYLFHNVPAGDYVLQVLPSADSNFSPTSTTISVREHEVSAEFVILSAQSPENATVMVTAYLDRKGIEVAWATIQSSGGRNLRARQTASIILIGGRQPLAGFLLDRIIDEPNLSPMFRELGEIATTEWEKSYTAKALADLLIRETRRGVENGKLTRMIWGFSVPPGDYEIVSKSPLITVRENDRLLDLAPGAVVQRRVYVQLPE